MASSSSLLDGPVCQRTSERNRYRIFSLRGSRDGSTRLSTMYTFSRMTGAIRNRPSDLRASTAPKEKDLSVTAVTPMRFGMFWFTLVCRMASAYLPIDRSYICQTARKIWLSHVTLSEVLTEATAALAVAYSRFQSRRRR